MRKGISVLAAAALLAIAAFALNRNSPKPVKFTLSDGTVAEVLKVTTGPNHRFRYDNRWQDFAGQVLPVKLRAKFKLHILTHTTTNADSLVLWVRSQPSLAQRPFGRSEPNITIADEHGDEVGSRIDFLPRPPGAAQPGSSNIWIGGRLIAPLPSHSREITLGFYERDKRLGELRLSNPAFRGGSALRPEGLPQSKPAGDVQVKLWSVESSKSPPAGRRIAWTINAELTRNGQALPGWGLDTVEVFDDMAQLPGPETWGPTYDPVSRRVTFHYLGAYWPGAAWKLRLWVAQVTNFPTAEIWTLKDVPVPDITERIEKREPRQFGDVKVELLGFGGPEAPGPPFGTGNRMTVHFSAPPRSEGGRITFLSGRDDTGRDLALAARGRRRGSVETYSFGFAPSPIARTVTLEFAVHRACSVDFVVKPSSSRPPTSVRPK